MRAKNPWAEKARALDRYRWRLLRERHGLVGSALRWLRDFLRDSLIGFAARRRLAVGAIPQEPCDFLLLQSSLKVIGLQRKKLLKHALVERGYRLLETALPDVRALLKARQLVLPPQPVPLRYFLFAAHAAWLVGRHAPRILLNDRNGSLYSPFLRLAQNARGHLLVQLAHATTVESSQRLAMNDYDYYFLFGQSSLAALRQRAVLFGASKAVLAGSHMIDRAYDLPPAEGEKRQMVLILGVGPDKEKEAGYRRAYALLREWVAAHPERRVRIKAHPRSRVPFWTEAETRLANLAVLPKDCTLAQALAEAGVVVNLMSNAVIEAALARRPVLFVNAADDPDIFGQADFFGPPVREEGALEPAFQRIQNDYAASLAHSAAFARFHLEAGSDGLDRTLEFLQALLSGQQAIPWQALAERETA